MADNIGGEDDKLVGKHRIELNIVDDGREFLNFWDYAHSNDVVCEIVNRQLLYSPPGSSIAHTISFNEFLDLVRESISKRTI